MNDEIYIGLDRATFSFWRNVKIETFNIDDYVKEYLFNPTAQQLQFVEAQRFLLEQKQQIEQDVQDVDFEE